LISLNRIYLAGRNKTNQKTVATNGSNKHSAEEDGNGKIPDRYVHKNATSGTVITAIPRNYLTGKKGIDLAHAVRMRNELELPVDDHEVNQMYMTTMNDYKKQCVKWWRNEYEKAIVDNCHDKKLIDRQTFLSVRMKWREETDHGQITLLRTAIIQVLKNREWRNDKQNDLLKHMGWRYQEKITESRVVSTEQQARKTNKWAHDNVFFIF
jgi:hypothetical protein